DAPYGMVLVTGPTGSGKTRTLYSALSSFNAREENICTAEDPVEYQLSGINQVNINNDVGLTYAAALKSFLRQDPDIILVGEIRDMETAEIAIAAAMTGHVVLSTLHTNDAPSTVTRLVDIGVDPVKVGTSVLCVVAQRLVRLICKNCKEEVLLDVQKAQAAGIDIKQLEGIKLFHGKGCAECRGRGVKERRGIFEVMPINEPVRRAIFDKKNASELRDLALAQGMRTLRESALIKLKAGDLSLDEL